jgi:hypothetical protein
MSKHLFDHFLNSIKSCLNICLTIFWIQKNNVWTFFDHFWIQKIMSEHLFDFKKYSMNFVKLKIYIRSVWWTLTWKTLRAAGGRPLDSGRDCPTYRRVSLTGNRVVLTPRGGRRLELKSARIRCRRSALQKMLWGSITDNRRLVSAEMPPPAVPKAGKLTHKQKAPAAFSGAASNAAVVIGSKPPATLPPGCKMLQTSASSAAEHSSAWG